jgi:hypothetical protein
LSSSEILKLQKPFTFAQLQKKGFEITQTELNKLVKENKLYTEKIGRMNIYWNPNSLFKAESGMNSFIKRLELENSELKKELMSERLKVQKLSIQDGIDNPWKDTAMAMARILSEQKQIALQEVLEYFNAPIDE